MTSYRFFKFKKCLSRKSTPGFGFSNSTRLAMSKSISIQNFDKTAQSTAVLLLLLIWENRHLPYWNYTSGFDLTYWSSQVLAFCMTFLASTVPKICWRSHNSKT